MFIYSVRVSVKKEIEEDWLKWMKEEHIKKILDTQYFSDSEIHKLILPDNPADESTYQINYSFNSMDDYQKYTQMEAPGLRQEHSEKFPHKLKISRAVYRIIPK
jgi:hypothetical protein